jgi:ketosteroid isomerase-like protein
VGLLSGRTIISVEREEADMGEARKVMDQITDAALKGDSEALKALYAQDAVAETPDQGTITGGDQIAAYMIDFSAAFPDMSWEELYKHETGDTAIDEGYLVGTNTVSMTGPNGETIPATGKRVRIRECDIATVENGVVTSHRFYFNVEDTLTQLGLTPESPA